MKIKVNYSELISGPGFNNRKAEAELELTVEGGFEGLGKAYSKAWGIVKDEVAKQLQKQSEDVIPF